MPSFTDLSNRLTIMISRHASLVFKNENVVFDIHRYCQQKKVWLPNKGRRKISSLLFKPTLCFFLHYLNKTGLTVINIDENTKWQISSNQWVWQYFSCDSKPLKAYTVQEQQYPCSLENVHTVWYTYKYNKTQKSSGSESSILKLM